MMVIGPVKSYDTAGLSRKITRGLPRRRITWLSLYYHRANYVTPFRRTLRSGFIARHQSLGNRYRRKKHHQTNLRKSLDNLHPIEKVPLFVV